MLHEPGPEHDVHALPPLSPRRKAIEWQHEHDAESGVLPEPHGVSTQDNISFAAVCFIVLCINMTFSLMAPIFPQEAERRGIIPVVTGSIFSIYNFGNFLIAPLLGRLMQTRVISRKHMLGGGCLVTSLSMVGFGLAAYIPDHRKAAFSALCLVMRTLNGLGAAATDTSSTAIAAELYQHTNWLGSALGLQESFLAIGWMVGPLFGGYLAVFGGFSLPFYTAAVIGVLLVPIALLIPTGQKPISESTEAVTHISPWSLLSHMEVVLYLTSAALSAAAVTFLDVSLAPFLKDLMGYSEGTIGDCFAAIAAFYAVGTVLGGYLSDTFNPRPVIITGLVISVIPFFTLAPTPLLTPLLATFAVPETLLIWSGAALVGLGCAFGFSPVVPAILGYTDSVGIKDGGLPDLVGGFASSSYYLGGGVGPLIGGSLTAVLGFRWATTIYGFGLLAFSAVSIVCLLISKQRRYAQISQEQLLENHRDL